ncbi:MAG: hypothetical protein AAGC63_10295 [Propionicimonas sp.]
MTHESPRRQRARLQAERRAASSGIGPAEPGQPLPAYPGATRWAPLFGEIMLVGLLVTLLSLPVVTLPLALATGARHLRAYLKGEDSGVRRSLADLRAGIGGGLAVGLAMVGLVAAATASLTIARTDTSVLGPPMTVVGWPALVATGTAVLMLAGAWRPERGWRGAVRQLGDQFEADPVGALLLALAAAFVAAAGWLLGPLVVPALGVAVFVVVILPLRRRAERTGA